MRHAFALGDTEHEVWLTRAAADGSRSLHALDGEMLVALALDREGRGQLAIDGRTVPVTVAVHGDQVFVHLAGQTFTLQHLDPLVRAIAHAHGGVLDEARAPMPGTVVSLLVAPGQQVVRGEPLLVMESMKLETTIVAWRDGVIDQVRVEPGQVFDRDAVLVTMEPQP